MRELTLAEILFVLPTGHVGVCGQSRKPLRNFIDRVLILLKELVAGSPSDESRVIDLVRPANLERVLLATQQGLRQIDPHHRVDNEVG